MFKVPPGGATIAGTWYAVLPNGSVPLPVGTTFRVYLETAASSAGPWTVLEVAEFEGQTDLGGLWSEERYAIPGDHYVRMTLLSSGSALVATVFAGGKVLLHW